MRNHFENIRYSAGKNTKGRSSRLNKISGDLKMRTSSKQATEIKRLSAGDLGPLADLVNHLSLAPHFPGDAVMAGADPVIRSPHHLGEASRMAQLLIGIAGAANLECAQR